MYKLSSKIKAEYLGFFKNNGCTVVPSDSLIPAGDKTLLFTSAGMVQFKQHFLGQSKDSFTRAASCQKCLRTSDIDQIGTTAKHLTFFEMLGNFSFGDYFKKEATAWAWEFLTKNMSLPKDKLYITIYKDDDETAGIWRSIAPANKIIKMDEKTNFWNMDEIGLCGPCSEILIDLGQEAGCGSSTCGPDCSCDRYLEIWNLVFTQFNRRLDGSLKNLPRKNIDTGMGLERLAAAVNGRKSVFDTDLFIPVMENAAALLKIKNEGRNTSKLRIIADHSRAATFLISDGILPSNEGRGYVLRRILRRALRQGIFYGHNKPFINELVSDVFKIMGNGYPELSSKLSNIRSIVKTEEEKFLETLELGSKILSNIINSYNSKGINTISGKDAFKLYDTYGFPCDLIKETASENGLDVDEDGFKSEQKNAQKKSRASWHGSGERDITFYSILHKKTGDTVFTGYDNYASESRVLALIKGSREASELKTGDNGEIILSHSSFYAQSGGQSADKGKITNSSFEGIVEDIFKPAGNLFVHKVKVLKGLVKINDTVSTIIDVERRKQIARHHTAVHLLHKVLSETFGEHITQSGSLVARDYFRFDFTHFSAVKKDDLIKIEKRINFIIRLNSKVCIETMAIEKARNSGATVLFGEKYGDEVRTVSIKNENGDGNYSMELCGGTHVNRTGDIGIFKIISESSVAAGVRRIEAAAGTAAENYILDEEAVIVKTSEILNTSKEELANRAYKYTVDYKKLENEFKSLKISLISDEVDSYAKEVKKINGINFLSIIMNNADVKMLRNMSDQLKEKLKSAVLLIVSKNEDRASFILSATTDCVEKGINAGKIAKAFAASINGSGGGKPDFAQGGSKNLLNLSDSVKNAHKYILL
jgi:alanyl-tRNA synthetase